MGAIGDPQRCVLMESCLMAGLSADHVGPSPHFLVLSKEHMTAVLTMWNRSSACGRRSGEYRGSHWGQDSGALSFVLT